MAYDKPSFAAHLVQTAEDTAGQYTSDARERTANVAHVAPNAVDLFSVTVQSNAAGTLYLQLHDAPDGTPVSTSTLRMPLGAVPAGAIQGYPVRSRVGKGLKLALSSTLDTYTDPAADNGWFLVRVA